MITETTYTRRIVGIINDGSDDSALTIIVSYSFTDSDGFRKVHELSVYGAYPNILRVLYHGNPVAFSRQIENQIMNIEGKNIIFNNKTLTIL